MEQGDSDTKENCVSILFSGWVHPSLEAHPAWLLEAEAKATTSGATLAAANLSRDSKDPKRCRLQVIVALCVKPTP